MAIDEEKQSPPILSPPRLRKSISSSLRFFLFENQLVISTCNPRTHHPQSLSGYLDLATKTRQKQTSISPPQSTNRLRGFGEKKEIMTRSEYQNQQDHQFKILHELSALVFNLLRSPTPSIGSSDHAHTAVQRFRMEGPSFKQITPAGFASLLLGISLSMMLCGSLTFFIGFILMPWVLGLVVFLYFVGIVSSISVIGRAILCHNSAPSSPRKDIPSWKLL